MSPGGRIDREPDVYRTVLPNGLRAIVRERPDTDVVAISVAIRGGSRDERRETVGAAHFMEHMFFQGTPRRPDSADLTARSRPEAAGPTPGPAGSRSTSRSSRRSTTSTWRST